MVYGEPAAAAVGSSLRTWKLRMLRYNTRCYSLTAGFHAQLPFSTAYPLVRERKDASRKCKAPLNTNVPMGLFAAQINVSISVTSRLVQSGSSILNFGKFGKYLGAAGFSLVNASNVPLRLGGLQINSELLSMKNLVGRGFRHYISQGLREAHKVPPSHLGSLQ
jgi:hypothetical protein